MWTTSKQIPADTDFDASVIDDAVHQEASTTRGSRPTERVYIADLMPTLFWTDAMFVASQKILGRRR